MREKKEDRYNIFTYIILLCSTFILIKHEFSKYHIPTYMYFIFIDQAVIA